MWDIIIKLGALVTALTAIIGAIVIVVKWFNKQNQQTVDIKDLREHHDKDMKKEAKEIQKLRDELCVISYGMLAALDGLKQLNCNGEVTKAHDMLSKHLNKQAHGQFRE